jgi:tRNA(fMet)-specific endonuclease VapC
MFILDTDHIGIVQWEAEPEYSRLMARFGQHAKDDFFVTVVSLHEEFLGWNSYISKAKKLDGVVKGYDKFLQILSDFEVSQILPFDIAAAQRFTQLRQQKVRIGTMDLRIAAIALSRSMTLLSRNLTDFKQVPNLVVEDWTV